MVSWPPRTAAVRGDSGGGALTGSLLAGKEDVEGAALADFAADFDPALVLLDNAIDGGQAQAGAFADFLGGEERLEDAGHGGGVHAAARCR